MNLLQLKYFVAAAEERSIHRAALRLHISQPPLTRQIRALEDSLGSCLFDRTNWGVELTPAGRYLLEQAYTLLAQVENTTRGIQQIETGQLGEIHVGIFGSAMFNIVPEILDRFTAAHPDVQLFTHILPRGEQLEALYQGRIQLGLDRVFPASPGLRIELVHKEPWVVALNYRHPLARQVQIHVKDLRNEPLIWDESPVAVAFITQLFDSHGIKPHFLLRTVDMMSAALMVASGVGTTLVAESMQDLNLPNVVFRPLITGCELWAELHCAYRHEDHSPILLELLRSIDAYRAGKIR